MGDGFASLPLRKHFSLPRTAQVSPIRLRLGTFSDVQARLSVNGAEHRSQHWSSQLVVCCSW